LAEYEKMKGVEKLMKIGHFNQMAIISFVLASLLIPVGEALAEEKVDSSEPTRFGVAMTGGKSYTGGADISFSLVTGFALFDYEKIWFHRAPEPLRFKIEASAGATTHPDRKFMASANIFALYYLRGLETRLFRPYVEGGIGVIYTDFKVEGQGLRLNFNPQIGIGTDLKVNPMTEFFIATRLHHISNGGLNHDNKGINSVTLMLGYYF
jgi:lipid A 3-O-deacylase